ncbi:membrane protein insertion efficiency factor YidD [Persephonella sp.]
MDRFLINLIKIYKKLVSPILPSSCRYYPTCSSYAIQSIEKYGALKGSLKAVWRVLRCNPFSKGGVDYP